VRDGFRSVGCEEEVLAASTTYSFSYQRNGQPSLSSGKSGLTIAMSCERVPTVETYERFGTGCRPRT